MKPLVRDAASRLDSLYSNKETEDTTKEKQKKKTLPFFRILWHQGPTGTLHMVSEQGQNART